MYFGGMEIAHTRTYTRANTHTHTHTRAHNSRDEYNMLSTTFPFSSINLSFTPFAPCTYTPRIYFVIYVIRARVYYYRRSQRTYRYHHRGRVVQITIQKMQYFTRS